MKTVDEEQGVGRCCGEEAPLDLRYGDSSRDIEEVLLTRAGMLARVPEQQEEIGLTMHVVEFLLARERYAVELAHVREVYPLQDYTPLPCTPAYVLGIINIRGQILSLIDLKIFLQLPAVGMSDHDRVIILRNDEMEFGVVADSISGVQKIQEKDLFPVPSTLSGPRVDFFKGVTGDRVALLDGAKLLADTAIIVDEVPAG